MKPNVTVKVHEPRGTPEQTTDDYVGASHAENGFPIEIRIARGNNATVQHISNAEAIVLARQLNAILGGLS